jgi:hypothetical protein
MKKGVIKMYQRILAQLKAKTKTEWIGNNPTPFSIGPDGFNGQLEVMKRFDPTSPVYAWRRRMFMRKLHKERKWRVLANCSDKEHFISHIIEDQKELLKDFKI